MDGPCRCLANDLWNGVHQPGDEYRGALFHANAGLGPDCDTYSPEGEVSGRGYVAGGIKLTGRSVEGGALSFDAIKWPNVTVKDASHLLIYNKSKNRALWVLAIDEGPTSATNGPFTLTAPRLPLGSA